MTYGGGLFGAYYQQRHNNPLPSGYRRVEYLESTGVQWIDTGVAASSATSRTMEIQAAYAGGDTVGCLYGASRYSPVFFYQLNKTTTANQFRLITQRGDVFYTLAAYANKHDYTLIGNKLYIDSSLVATGAGSQVDADIPIYLFARCYIAQGASTGVAGQLGIWKIWKMKVVEDEDITRSFVPCVRIADNKPGMYDLCGSICPLTNTPFYINSGTGADFTWGELPQNLPTDGLVFYHTLTTASSTPEVGATMTKSGTLTATVEDGIPCVYFPGAAYMYNSQGFAYSQGTITAWVKPIRQYDSSTFQGHIVSLNDGDPNHIFPPCTFKESDHRVNYNYPDIFSKWHFVATTFNRNDGYRCNYCGKLYNEVTVTYAQGNIPYISLGTFLSDSHSTRKNFSIVGYVAAARIYNRILSQNELDILAHEFTPTP